MAIALAGLGCVRPDAIEQEGDALRIGALLSYTGDLAASGTNSEQAMRMALDLVNDAGGVAGKPLRLVLRDTHSNAERARTRAESLFDESGLIGLIGPPETESIRLIAPMVAERRIADVLPTLTAPRITEYPKSFWFRLAPSAETAGCVLAEQLYREQVDSMAVFFREDAFNRALAEATAARFRQVSILAPPSVDLVVFDPNQQTFLTALQETQAKKPDVIVLATSPGSGALVIADSLALEEKPRWYLSPALRTEQFLRNVPPAALDGATGVSPLPSKDAAAFASAYAARWAGEEPLPESFYHYDALALLALAAESAAFEAGGPPSPEAVRDHVGRVSTGAGTAVHWNELGQGLELLRAGSPVNYFGVSSQLDLTESGELEKSIALLRFWHIKDSAFEDDRLGSCFVR